MEVGLPVLVSCEYWEISENTCLPRYYNSCGQGIVFKLFEIRTKVLPLFKGIVVCTRLGNMTLKFDLFYII